MTGLDYLDEFLQLAGATSNMDKYSRYLLDLSLIEYQFCLLKPSVVGWAVVVVCGRRVGIEVSQEWGKGFGIGEGELREAVRAVEGLLARRNLNKFA